jgi:hypothetical protein
MSHNAEPVLCDKVRPEVVLIGKDDRSFRSSEHIDIADAELRALSRGLGDAIIVNDVSHSDKYLAISRSLIISGRKKFKM